MNLSIINIRTVQRDLNHGNAVEKITSVIEELQRDPRTREMFFHVTLKYWIDLNPPDLGEIQDALDHLVRVLRQRQPGRRGYVRWVAPTLRDVE